MISRSVIWTFAALVTALLVLTVTNPPSNELTVRTPTIVRTIHNVSYHGMTCTETIDSTGNSYMNDCEASK